MRKIEILPGVTSSILGFGGAPILGAVDGKSARRAISCALDCGITHFDLARSYGYGEAEAFVGKILRNRRDQVTIATKFGISANWKAFLLRPAKPIFRVIRAARKKTSAGCGVAEPAVGVPTVAHRFHDRLPMRGADMRKSVETSLRSLRTDYLDVLLLHEPREALLEIRDLHETALSMKREGKIRAWGLAFYCENAELHRDHFDLFDVLQFNHSPGSVNYSKILEGDPNRARILFSPFRANPARRSPSEILKGLFSNYPSSVVLCSMFNPDHIKQNSEACRGL